MNLNDTQNLTLAIIKPNLMNKDFFAKAGKELLKTVKSSGFKIIARKVVNLGQEHEKGQTLAQKFYAEHQSKSFYDDLIKLMSSNCFVFILEKIDGQAVETWRNLIGQTDPQKDRKANKKTLRAQWGGEIKLLNGFHGSDSNESATREIELLFPKFLRDYSCRNSHSMLKKNTRICLIIF